MFRGLSAFPLTPLRDDQLDEDALARLVGRLAAADVDSITVLGSTGVYPYLARDERRRAIEVAVEHAAGTPVLAGIGALRTSQVVALGQDALAAGASGVLLAPVSYHRLSDDEVFGLYRDVTGALAAPLVVYDNPGTTHVEFSEELHARIAALPHVASVKLPGIADPAAAQARVRRLRALVPASVTIGVSGDGGAATGLLAGSDIWYSSLGGVIPGPIAAIARAALAGDGVRARAWSDRLQGLWDLLGPYGGVRVSAAIAEELGVVGPDCLPRPLLGLPPDARAGLRAVLQGLSSRSGPDVLG